MMENFDDIRPYRDNEFKAAFRLLAQEQEFIAVLKYLYQDKIDDCLKMLYKVETLDEFQVKVIKPFLQGVISSTMTNLNYTGIENIPKEYPCLFISNHRDIVMDPSLIDIGLNAHNIPTVEIAIGDNLLIKPWIELLVKLNKSFVVRRSLSGRDLLKSSAHLSKYIRQQIVENGSYIWIAQREGRAKDGNDRTQEGLLRMLAMSAKGLDMKESLHKLNIVPVSISYEYDPCDGLKARELWQKSVGGDYVKTPKDDLISMETGIKGRKGNVDIHFAPGINDKLNQMTETDARKQSEEIARFIDEGIFKSYSLSDTHKTAYNLLYNSSEFDVKKDKAKSITEYFIHQLQSVGMSEQELPYILQQYANPVVNFKKVNSK